MILEHDVTDLLIKHSGDFFVVFVVFGQISYLLFGVDNSIVSVDIFTYSQIVTFIFEPDTFFVPFIMDKLIDILSIEIILALCIFVK